MNTEQLKTEEKVLRDSFGWIAERENANLEIKEYHFGEYPDSVQRPKIYQAMQDFARQEIQRDRESRWISVKNKLPKHEDYVLITDGLEVWVGSYGSEDFRGRKSWGQAYVGSSMVDDTKITHWQPLPEAPKL